MLINDHYILDVTKSSRTWTWVHTHPNTCQNLCIVNCDANQTQYWNFTFLIQTQLTEAEYFQHSWQYTKVNYQLHQRCPASLCIHSSASFARWGRAWRGSKTLNAPWLKQEGAFTGRARRTRRCHLPTDCTPILSSLTRPSPQRNIFTKSCNRGALVLCILPCSRYFNELLCRFMGGRRL